MALRYYMETSAGASRDTWEEAPGCEASESPKD